MVVTRKLPSLHHIRQAHVVNRRCICGRWLSDMSTPSISCLLYTSPGPLAISGSRMRYSAYIKTIPHLLYVICPRWTFLPSISDEYTFTLHSPQAITLC